LHSRLRQSIQKTWGRCSSRREHIDPDACTLQVQRLPIFRTYLDS
jgi:hypothetical protein